MNYKIFQLDPENENVRKDRKLFENWDTLNKISSFNEDEYKKVYEGEVSGNTLLGVLDSLFQTFNLNHPDDFRGHSLSVSDVVELDGVKYYCDSFYWVNVKTGEKV